MWFTPTNVLVIALFIQSSHAYSLGAPDAACKRMTPGHGFDAVNQSPDPSGAPVKLTLNPPDGSDIVPGQTVSVSLEAQGEPGFKGFIIQARDEQDSQVGSFTIEGDLVSHMTCGKGIHNSITHRNGEDKKINKGHMEGPR